MMIIVILDMISKILYHLVIYTNAFTEKNIMFGIYFNPVVGEGREKWGDGWNSIGQVFIIVKTRKWVNAYLLNYFSLLLSLKFYINKEN